jgi:hypothetical protein
MLMREKKFLIAITPQAFRQFTAFPVERHTFSIALRLFFDPIFSATFAFEKGL